jgi:hypothetical protein
MIRVDQERMLMAFLDLDREERAARLMVEEYRTILPDRAGATTIVPRHHELQQEVTAVNEAYVTLADAYPPPDALRPPRLQEAGLAYRAMAERLEEMASRVASFLEAAGGELRKVGAAKEQANAQLELVRRHLSRAVEAVERLESAGHRSSAATTALEQTRAAARLAVSWSPADGVSWLSDIAEQVLDASTSAVEAAEDFPQLVAAVPNRARSLRTRLESADNRSRTMAEELGHLRRAYRGDDWLDIDRSEELAREVRDRASSLLEELDRAVAEGCSEDALGLVDDLRSELDVLDEVVNAPRVRRERLEVLQTNPRQAVGQARFAVRDAQMMVQAGTQQDLARFAPQLDALSARVQRVQADLAEGSPSLWRTAQELDAIVEAVGGLGGAIRAATRA